MIKQNHLDEYKDEKWDQILFENANKCHLHQDNLRWKLAAAFAAFFYGSILLLQNEKIAQKLDMIQMLQILFFILGTLYWIAVCVEGWYYNLYLKYLIDCEERIIKKKSLEPFSKFDRSSVKMFHPSFSSVLFLMAVANGYYLYSFLHSITVCVIYILLAAFFIIKGYVFKFVEITKSKQLIEKDD